MPHVEQFDPGLERAHSRMDDIERRILKFNNPAPTVPQYDLHGPSIAPDCYLVSADIIGTDGIRAALRKDLGGPRDTDTWVRVNTRQDIAPRTLTDFPVVGLVFDEWLNDTHFNNNTGPEWVAPGANVVAGGPWSAFPANVNNVRYSFSTFSYAETQGIIDLGMSFTGTAGTSNTSNAYGNWHLEVWVDDQQAYTAEWGAQLFHPGPSTFIRCTKVNSLWISGSYGNSDSIYRDDISVGTGRGLSDLIGPITFDDHSLSAFTQYSNDNNALFVECR